MKDILLVISDQHGQAYTQMQDPRIDTPALKRIANKGVSFERCYCNAPLCVPSRMSFLTGKLPAELGIWDNDTPLPMDMPTIAHAMGIEGYHTVLIGRMHFKGDDQKHGFDERLIGDITSQYWGTGGNERTDFGAYINTTNRKHCLDVVGGGYSPVMAYDEMVYQQAMKYLQSPHKKPLFLVVGFYAPHIPFTCDIKKYQKYQARFSQDEVPVGQSAKEYEDYVQHATPEKLRNCKAAYCGLVETIDHYVGNLYDSFSEGRKDYAFLYTSDHAEQLGKRSIMGKQTLYEDAIRIPFIMAGSNIPVGVSEEQISLLDVSKTILDLAGVVCDWHQGIGVDFSDYKAHRRPICIQQMLEYKGRPLLAEAVIQMPYKAVKIDGKIHVYHIVEDIDEEIDIADTQEGNALKKIAEGYFLNQVQIVQSMEWKLQLSKRHEILKAWGKIKKPEEAACVKIPEAARHKPIE